MAIIAPPMDSLNLTEGLLNQLTSKLAKEPEVREVEVSESGSTTQEETTSMEDFPTIGIIHEHVPVRSIMHKETVHLRQDLQLHLRSVMRTGDDMLVKIRLIIEELDTAVHAKNLAIQELEVITEKRKELKRQFELVSTECTALRARLLDMSKARDIAEIALEASAGQLLEKTEECNELKRESIRLHEQITIISEKLVTYTSRLSKAESDVRRYVFELKSAKDELEVHKRKIVEIEAFRVALAEEVKVVRFENKDLKLQIEKINLQLISVRTKLTTITVELAEAKIELERCIVIRDEAILERDQAIKDREAARIIAEEAVLIRDDAIKSRDQAIFTEKSTMANWIRDSSLLEDCRRSLTTVQQTVIVITAERNEAISSAANWEHLRDEAIENFREADAARHRLQVQLKEAARATKLAEELAEEAKDKTRLAERQRELIIIEKEQVEIVLSRTEREKNAAIARQLKIQDDYIEADRQRDEALEKFKKMEDLYQISERDLATLQGMLETSLADEKSAKLELQIATDRLQRTKDSEAALTKERNELSEKLAIAETEASRAKNDLADQVGKLTKERDQLQQGLTDARQNESRALEANEKLLKEKKDLTTERDGLVKENSSLKDQLKAANDEVLKSGSPIPASKDGVVIRHIFFGGVRITSKDVYETVMNTYAHNDGCVFAVNTKFFKGQVPSNSSSPRTMVVYYATPGKDGVVADRTPLSYKDGSKDNKFYPVF